MKRWHGILDRCTLVLTGMVVPVVALWGSLRFEGSEAGAFTIILVISAVSMVGKACIEFIRERYWKAHLQHMEKMLLKELVRHGVAHITVDGQVFTLDAVEPSGVEPECTEGPERL